MVKEEVQKDPKPEMVEAPEPVPPKLLIENESDPRLRFWIKRVEKRVNGLWNQGRVGTLEPIVVTVMFTVARNGQVSDISISSSSGNSVADSEALRAIRRVERLPPIPPNYPADQLRLGYEFEYQE
ncbi:MAG: energy transducer TonB [Okeania sp. SIO1H5]|uniref:energy transducer TonB family protein n=1 Tax=Okeania sp. SIO1H5 TaxID=2607777 RepID=UPI0013B9270D|nr:energy transducer TonB [Okeania sp. SIO1H5]NET23570.1 energy transducer TonB [Okeania sp. SIO1H5]